MQIEAPEVIAATQEETATPEYIGTSTYPPEDNKIRIYPFARLDSETYERVKAAGYKWAPKQELFVAPTVRASARR